MTSDMAGPDEVLRVLRAAGVVTAGDARLEPLTGGVASDIWKVEAGGRTIVVKRALSKLRVAADWRAPVSRNASEAEWFRAVAGIMPEAVPEVLFHDPAHGLFAMTYYPADRYPVWKALLRDGQVDPGFAAATGAALGRIHARTAGDARLARDFANDATFHAIRLEPYLEATARRHPEIGERLMALSAATLATREALVHGDVSPKNILAGPGGPIFLDAECAWYGDPAFDLAFCLNHLLLKCLWTPAAAPAFLDAFGRLREAYLAELPADRRRAVETRAARLLPGLFLARVDGKSPVEYITDEPDRARVRAAAIPLIRDWPDDLMTIRAAWARALNLTGAQ
jgi:aminoglycoside phosphotransferase (APT) family kinase protein